ncbi:GntR family transcriptional regulator [Mycolicibacterium nivoides]|jgi:DNA-binding GntR family transcriptional regulator|uniref:GntR family transcriptional regulator n=1 Tax=Mycolicibacterium nivoides TaxID=2487344 RepID=UPI0008D39532|nr:GntR family transcriptional regulator [Mycolicibacterium nivoides]SEP85291.1 DNA-binding transcriptional regulator, GntR family [Mycobacterium sp. 88mf]SFF19842.1 DNA-binding transcriptional regulator, GntR family [Mycobacterium sp. 455mf]
MPFELSTRSVGEALVVSLRERILTEDIPAGRPVTEALVASDYGVARQTAKAAIEHLVAEGLLKRTAHRSARVPILDIAEVQDLYFARRFIESQAYGLLARQRTYSDAARQAHEAFRSAVVGEDLVTVVEADIRLHTELVHSLGSPHLDRAHRLVVNEMRLCLAQVQSHHLLDPAVIHEEHSGILTAIAEGDHDLALQLGDQHLANAEQRLLEHLGNRPR